MTDGAWEIVGRDYRELPLGRTIGDALRELIRARFPHHAAKKIEAIWGLDAKTARNVVSQGNVSERTLTKAAKAERWALWMALGEMMFEESYDEWEERRLRAIIEEAERDLDRVRRLRPQGADVPHRSLPTHAAGVLASGEGGEPAASGEGRRGMRSAGEGDRREPLTAKARGGRS